MGQNEQRQDGGTNERPDIGALGESFIERICSLAFFDEYVFRGPKFSRGRQEKELCDVLVLFDDIAIVIEVKTLDRRGKAAWTRDEIESWTREKLADARRQIRGAIGTIKRGLIEKVANAWQGEVDLGTLGIRRYFGIAAIDCLPSSKHGRCEPIVHGDTRCEMMELSFNELSEILQELSTLPDLVTYLDFRERFFGTSQFLGAGERDLLVLHQTKYPQCMEAMKAGKQIVMEDGLWEQYQSLGIKAERDRQRKNGELVDFIIRRLRDAKGYVPDHVREDPNNANAITGTYLEAVRWLSRLSRTERIVLGEGLVKKSDLCERTLRPRHFLFIPRQTHPYLVVVSNEERGKRGNYLKNLLDLAMIVYRASEGLGLAINSGHHQPWAIDVIVARRGPNYDHDLVDPSDLELAGKFFKPPRAVTESEYGRLRAPASIKRFKRRKRR